MIEKLVGINEKVLLTLVMRRRALHAPVLHVYIDSPPRRSPGRNELSEEGVAL